MDADELRITPATVGLALAVGVATLALTALAAMLVGAFVPRPVRVEGSRTEAIVRDKLERRVTLPQSTRIERCLVVALEDAGEPATAEICRWVWGPRWEGLEVGQAVRVVYLPESIVAEAGVRRVVRIELDEER